MTDTWFASISPESGIRILQNDPRLTIICEVPAAYTNKDAVKDAYLLAAAPDLYAALDEILTASEADYGIPDDGDEDDEAVAWTQTGGVTVTFGMLRRSKAALSKARRIKGAA